MNSFGQILGGMSAFASRAAGTFSASGSRSAQFPARGPTASSSARNSREVAGQLSPMRSHSLGSRTGLSSMSAHRGKVKTPGLSDIIRKGFDAFNASMDIYKSGNQASPGAGNRAFSKAQLAPLHRNFSANPERAARQEAFVNTYMPHLKGLSAIQSGMEKVARGMFGLPAEPPKSGATHSWPDLASVDRKASKKPGPEAMGAPDVSRQEAFIRNHMPHASPLLKMQQGLERSFRALMGAPGKRPDQPALGQKVDPVQMPAQESSQRSPMERGLSTDPGRAARQQAFLQKYMPHVAALSNLQSSLESSVRDAIKGPKNNASTPKAAPGATL